MNNVTNAKSFWLTAGGVIGFATIFILEQMGIPAALVLTLGIIYAILMRIAWSFPKSRVVIGVILGILTLGSGWVELKERFQFPEFSITRITPLVQYDPNGSTDEIKNLNQEKYVPDLQEGAGWVYQTAWVISIIAFFVMIVTKGWIPLQVLFVVGWGVASYFLISSPVNTPEMNPATSSALTTIWWWGASKSLVWMAIGTVIPIVLQLIGSGFQAGAQLIRHPLPILIWSAMTWAGVSLAFTIFDPGLITWTGSMVLVHETQLTATLAQEALVSGQVAFFAVNGVVRTIGNLFE